MLLASATCLLFFVIFLACAVFDLQRSHGVVAEYFGFAFPQPPGRFAAMAFASLVPGLLFAGHAVYSKLWARS
jgi:hypothetical protein